MVGLTYLFTRSIFGLTWPEMCNASIERTECLKECNMVHFSQQCTIKRLMSWFTFYNPTVMKVSGEVWFGIPHCWKWLIMYQDHKCYIRNICSSLLRTLLLNEFQMFYSCFFFVQLYLHIGVKLVLKISHSHQPWTCTPLHLFENH